MRGAMAGSIGDWSSVAGTGFAPTVAGQFVEPAIFADDKVV